MKRFEATLRRAMATQRQLPPGLALPAANSLGAIVIGVWLAGWWGLVIGPLAYGAFLAAFRLLAPAGGAVASLRPRRAMTSRPSPRVALLPPAMASDVALPPVVYRIAKSLMAPFSEANLPWTTLNIVLAVLLICVIQGIDFAFWLALAAVPVLIVGLMMMSLDGQKEEDPEA